MILSTAHAAARAAAARLPALQASFDLLATGTETPCIQLYTGADPDTGTLLAIIPMASGVGAVDAGSFRINLTAPIEGLAVADGEAGCALVLDANGDPWGLATVSDTEGSGEIKLASTALVTGVFSRITSAYFQG